LYRGSRKHVLDWTGRPSFLPELAQILEPVPVHFPADTVFMPRGVLAPEEARLEKAGPALVPGVSVWREIEDWWLCHKAGANTPNWDIAAGCEVEGRSGLVLVEAKAHRAELGTGGKPVSADASVRSIENHERIGEAIEEACQGWRALDERVSISRDSHYQLANRLALTWKLASLGIPVVLLYLGFAGDDGISDVGDPFADDADWHAAFDAYSAEVAPSELLDRRLEIGSTPAWLLSRSRPMLGVS